LRHERRDLPDGFAVLLSRENGRAPDFLQLRTSRLATDILDDMSLLDLIIEKTGVRTASNSVAADSGAQVLIASLLALVASSDGGISPDENMRIVNLLGKRFGLSAGEASDLVARALENHPSHDQVDEVLDSVNAVLSRSQKEDLMFMVLCVIAADNKKDVAEMELLNKLVDTFRLPDATMQKMYEGNFDLFFY
jgi:uncharacterized tellurite resistance protein B-like protein